MNATFPWWGYALLSAFFAALTTIFAKIGVNQVSSNLATAIRTAVVLLIVWGIVFFTGEVNGLNSVPRRVWLFLILSAAATGLSWLFYFKGLQVGKGIVGRAGRQVKRGARAHSLGNFSG
jgi:transporter family protein